MCLLVAEGTREALFWEFVERGPVRVGETDKPVAFFWLFALYIQTMTHHERPAKQTTPTGARCAVSPFFEDGHACTCVYGFPCCCLHRPNNNTPQTADQIRYANRNKVRLFPPVRGRISILYALLYAFTFKRHNRLAIQTNAPRHTPY